MNVAVIGGAGYVGLVTGVGLAEIGHQVVGVDVDQGRLDRLAAGVSAILEAGMDDALTRNLARGTLRFSSDLHDAVRTSTFVFIAVGTPAGDGGAADLSQVVGVIEDVARSIDGYTVVISSRAPSPWARWSRCGRSWAVGLRRASTSTSS